MYEDKTYSSILQDALQEISAGVQTGEGYLTYNALSALAYELQKLPVDLRERASDKELLDKIAGRRQHNRHVEVDDLSAGCLDDKYDKKV